MGAEETARGCSGGVMFWAGIVGNRIVGPFKVDSALKMNSEIYSQFLDDHFSNGTECKVANLNRTVYLCMIMHLPMHQSIQHLICKRKEYLITKL